MLLFENGHPAFYDGVLAASRRGRIVSHWINAKVIGGTSPTVLTDGPSGDQPGIYYNIPEGYRLIVTDVLMIVSTKNDGARFEFGVCTAVNGGGTFVPKSMSIPIGTENKIESQHVGLSAPGVAIRYADGVRSVTWRVTCDNTTTEVYVEWRGITERDL